jgi:hypothetical protein
MGNAVDSAGRIPFRFWFRKHSRLPPRCTQVRMLPTGEKSLMLSRAEMQDRLISSTREIFRDAGAIANNFRTPKREVVHFLVKANLSRGKIVKGRADIC